MISQSMATPLPSYPPTTVFGHMYYILLRNLKINTQSKVFQPSVSQQVGLPPSPLCRVCTHDDEMDYDRDGG